MIALRQPATLAVRPNGRSSHVRAVLAMSTSDSTRNCPPNCGRRLLMAVPLITVLSNAAGAKAAETPKRFIGFSQAPDLYLGYGAAGDAPPTYQFEYPADWEEETVTKTEKSTMGMDGRVMHPHTKKELAYVIALGGKDYRDSVLKDARTSLMVVAGGDPDMRQALSDGTVQQSLRRVDGTDMYVYELASQRRHYLSSVAKKGDTVFALVVTAPAAAFERDEPALRHIQESFRLL